MSAEIPGYLFLLLGVLAIGSNWYHLIVAKLQKQSTSFTPFLGGVVGVLGILSTSVPNIYLLVPLVVDFTVPYTFLVLLKGPKMDDPQTGDGLD